MKNKQNCCTRSRIQSKIGLGNAGSGAYSSASIPTDFEFPFAELGVEPWIKQGSPKLQEVLVPGYRAVCMAGQSWSFIPQLFRLPGSPPGELAGNQLGALPVLCWKFIEYDMSPWSISVLMNWHFPVKTCVVVKFLTSCSPGCHAAEVLALCTGSYGCAWDVLSPFPKFVCWKDKRVEFHRAGGTYLSLYCLSILLFFLCYLLHKATLLHFFCSTLA